MAKTVRPAERQLEPIHIKLLQLIERGPANDDGAHDTPGAYVHQTELEEAMKPDPMPYALEQMSEYGLIENPDPSQRKDWILTRRGETTLKLELKRLATAKAKAAEKPKGTTGKAPTKPAAKNAGTPAPA